MNEIKTQAIVLSSTDYKDADKKLALFSCEFGLIFATIKGVKKPKAKLASFAQPFCFAEYLLSKNGDFFTVINASSIENFFNLTGDFDKYIVGTAMLEFCRKTVSAFDPALELFVLLLKALKQLDMTSANAMAVLIKFLIEAFAVSGYKLKIDRCAKCQSFLSASDAIAYSYEKGGVVCQKCANKNEAVLLTKKEQKVLLDINSCELDNIFALAFDGRDELVSVIGILCKQFRLLFGEELKTIGEYL